MWYLVILLNSKEQKITNKYKYVRRVNNNTFYRFMFLIVLSECDFLFTYTLVSFCLGDIKTLLLLINLMYIIPPIKFRYSFQHCTYVAANAVMYTIDWKFRYKGRNDVSGKTTKRGLLVTLWKHTDRYHGS